MEVKLEEEQTLLDDYDRVEQEYQEGLLRDLSEALGRVLVKRRDEIQAFRKTEGDLLGTELDDDLAIRLYILNKQAVDLKLDVEAQLEEIAREKWYRREEGCDQTDDEIALDWVNEHAANWRAYRTTAYVYVYDRNRDELLAAFNGVSDLDT